MLGGARGVGRPAKRKKQVHGSSQEQRRGIEPWHGPGKNHFRNGAAEDCAERVTGAVQKVNGQVEIGEGAQPARVSIGEGSERQEQQIGHRKADEPGPEIESGHREPGVSSAYGENGRVVDREKVREGFIGHMGAERQAKKEPGPAEIGGRHETCWACHEGASDLRDVLSDCTG